MERLEMTLLVKPPKRLEFKQTLFDLKEKLQKSCTDLKIIESNNFLSYSILAQWKTEVKLQETLRTKEFEILSGAITALCEKIEIRQNDKLVGNHISMLTNLKKTKLKSKNHEF